MSVVKTLGSEKSILLGALMAASLVVSGCSDSDGGVSVADSANGAVGDNSDPTQGNNTPTGGDQSSDGSASGSENDGTSGGGSTDDADTSSPAGPADNSDSDVSADNDDNSDSDVSADNNDNTAADDDSNQADNDEADNDVSVSAAFAGGADETQRADNDESPTLTESLSIAGPFVKDATRGAGPPTAPSGLTQLMAGENWIEFSWAPSTDDQSVEAYEIYRDGQLIHTVTYDSSYEPDIVNWQTTSFMDCNYTRYSCSAPNRQPLAGTSYSYSVAAIDNEGQRSARSEAAVFSTATPGQGPVDLSSYRQVFNEDFNDTKVDRERWKTSLPWGPDDIINRETQYFVNTFGSGNQVDYDPFVFTGETLQITAINTPADQLSAANNQPYLSGVLSTSDYFEMTYGYVEMRAKVASGTGTLSTFYLFNQDFYKNKPEIDIMEYQGEFSDRAYQTYHYYDSNLNRSGLGEKHSSPTMQSSRGINLSDDFHTYSVLWEPELAVWYIDGVEVQRIEGIRVSDEPMNIVTQLVIGSEWIGAVAPSSIPAVLEIDYIKAWQN